MERLPADEWHWYNGLSAHFIHGLVALSLGLHPDSCQPSVWPGGGSVGAADTKAEFDARFIATYDAARAGLCKAAEHVAPTHDVARAGGLELLLLPDRHGQNFDASADVRNCEHWEITILSFRQFCDLQGWDVPDEFRPVGYVVSHVEKQDGVETAPAPRSQGNDTKRPRDHYLMPVIQAAVDACGSHKVADVWLKLIAFAQRRHDVLIEVVPKKGISYIHPDAVGVQYLKRTQVATKLRTLRDRDRPQ